MPAISADTMVLPRIPAPDPAAADRPVVSVTTAPSGLEGEGFPVRRAFAGVDLQVLDPFVHMDQMGEVEYAPGEHKGTPWHTHRGFETVTYMIDGIFQHQDSNGGGGLITDGDTQWMTAGSGLIHIEAPPEEVVMRGGLFHGFQLWVNLPAKLKWNPPRYQDIRGRAVSLLSSSDGGALLRVIAGEVAGYQGPGVTYTPITLLHATLLAVFGPGDVVTVAANVSQETRSPQLDVLMLGGLPIREPVAAYGPFVMNTRAELLQAFEDYQAGRLGTIPAVPAEPRPGHEVLNETTEPR